MSNPTPRDNRLRLWASAPRPRLVRRSFSGGGCLSASVCRVTVIVMAMCAVGSLGYTQGRRVSSGVRQVVPYDSRVVFTRIAYNVGLGGFGIGSNAWNHDYPTADRNVGAIIDYITHARVRLDGTNVLT